MICPNSIKRVKKYDTGILIVLISTIKIYTILIICFKFRRLTKIVIGFTSIPQLVTKQGDKVTSKFLFILHKLHCSA